MELSCSSRKIILKERVVNQVKRLEYQLSTQLKHL